MTREILCIYHDHCTDGFAAAWAVRRALGDAVSLHAASYGTAPPDATGRSVLLVDFSYKRDVLDRMAEKANWVLILDHHKTAAEDLAGLPLPSRSLDGLDRASTMPLRPIKITALFDMARSGAGLAWDFFHPGKPRPWMIDLIETRDLWRTADARWTKARLLHAYLNSFPFDFAEWDEHHRVTKSEEGQAMVLREGAAILRQHDKEVAELISITKRRMVIGGHDVPVACLPPWMASDGGHLMGESEPFAASYYDGAKIRAFSLRSRPDGLDVSEIAKKYGGGGHAHAAGFSVPIGWEGDAA